MAADYAYVLGEVWESMPPIVRKKLLDTVEGNITSDSQIVKDVWATGFLEGLSVEIDKNNIPLDELLDYIGAESLEYMNAWDVFCGLEPYTKS